MSILGATCIEKGWRCGWCPSPGAGSSWRTFSPALDGRTKLVALSSVAYHNGFRLDLEALGAALNRKRIPFYVDAIQSLGVQPVDVARCGISFLSADGHKWLLGPEGAGLFFCSERCPLTAEACLCFLAVGSGAFPV